MWGSRVVGKPSGVVYELEYEYKKGYPPGIAFILEGARLTIGDVTKQEKIEIIEFGRYRTLISITHFVPHCRFPPPKPDGVDLMTSFPFSRFVKGQGSFVLSFNVQGAESSGVVGDLIAKLIMNYFLLTLHTLCGIGPLYI
ncbi:unnamed protein product [Taenia asiatica]|uniref:DUF5727 domain-containing protein n=1 Tax=Taenia asiatica TaxID=60517 RepID=A0A3P6QDV0_TAEAS|nr:unnamed protein product [Taenia asiatica]